MAEGSQADWYLWAKGMFCTSWSHDEPFVRQRRSPGRHTEDGNAEQISHLQMVFQQNRSKWFLAVNPDWNVCILILKPSWREEQKLPAVYKHSTNGLQNWDLHIADCLGRKQQSTSRHSTGGKWKKISEQQPCLDSEQSRGFGFLPLEEREQLPSRNCGWRRLQHSVSVSWDFYSWITLSGLGGCRGESWR